jgi:DNA-binding NtrC family response regulator
MVAKKILLVDDDRLVLESLGDWLTAQGYTVATASGVERAIEIIEKEKLQLILTDIRLGTRSGLELLSMSRRLSPPTPVILMSGYATLDTGIEALRAGAFDLLRKPVMDEELTQSINRAIDPRQAVVSQPPRLRLPTEVIGHDSTLQETFGVIENVADTKTTILISGESGTGKSLIARSIHRQSGRRDKPFVEVACGALTETLLESELFGHVTGAFTGAVADKQGKFSQAQGGTIFLDEISTASPRMQVKLLRVLQEFKFEAVGGTQTHEADTRVILATNDDLGQAVENGSFRRDLYYRVNVINLEIPPLRERVADISALCDHFLALVCRETGKPLARFSEGALARLRQHDWPGNVRELQNVVERAVLLSPGDEIGPTDLPNEVLDDNVTTSSLYSCGQTLKKALERPERQIIRQALQDSNGNRSQAAEVLGINRTTLYKKMRRLGLDNDPSRTAPLELPLEVDHNAVSSS